MNSEHKANFNLSVLSKVEPFYQYAKLNMLTSGHTISISQAPAGMKLIWTESCLYHPIHQALILAKRVCGDHLIKKKKKLKKIKC